MTPNDFGERLRVWRRAADLTQQAIAAGLGVSNQALGRAESGNNYLSPENLAKLNEIYGLNINWLLTGLGPMLIPKGNAGREVCLCAWDTAEFPLNDGLFREVVSALDEGISQQKPPVVVDSDRRMNLTLTLYRMAVGLGRPVHPAIIRNLLALCPALPYNREEAKEGE